MQLPDRPTAAPAGQPAEITDLDREQAARWLAALDEITEEKPTAIRVDDPAIPSFQDGARIGESAPVPQPDSRIVPAWAAGIAVASIGVGAGVTGVGCGAWLVLQGLASVTLYGVLAVTLPLAGVAMVITAIGGLASRVKRVVEAAPPTHHHHYAGPVTQDSRQITTRTNGVIANTRNQSTR